MKKQVLATEVVSVSKATVKNVAEKNTVTCDLNKVKGFEKLTANVQAHAIELFKGGVSAEFSIKWAGKSLKEVCKDVASSYGVVTNGVTCAYIKSGGDWDAVKEEMRTAGFDTNNSSYKMAKKRLNDGNKEAAKDATKDADKGADKGADDVKKLSALDVMSAVINQQSYRKELLDCLTNVDHVLFDKFENLLDLAGYKVVAKKK